MVRACNCLTTTVLHLLILLLQVMFTWEPVATLLKFCGARLVWTNDCNNLPSVSERWMPNNKHCYLTQACLFPYGRIRCSNHENDSVSWMQFMHDPGSIRFHALNPGPRLHGTLPLLGHLRRACNPKLLMKTLEKRRLWFCGTGRVVFFDRVASTCAYYTSRSQEQKWSNEAGKENHWKRWTSSCRFLTKDIFLVEWLLSWFCWLSFLFQCCSMCCLLCVWVNGSLWHMLAGYNFTY